MMQPRSIRFRFSLVFFFFLALVVVLGLFSIGRLKDLNAVSADVRERWLQNTRYLGDLNNYTSDFRAAEATFLLSVDAEQRATSEKDIISLDAAILGARKGYEHIYHDAVEIALYRRFSSEWERYRTVADQVLKEAHRHHASESLRLYMTDSRQAYDAASDTLGILTDSNVTNASEASTRASATYWQARMLIDVAILIAGFMVIAAVWYIRHSISNPLRKIATSMRHLAANETDIDIPDVNRHDEIGEMARTVVVFRNNAVDLALSRHGLAQQASMLEEKLEQEQRLTALQRNFVMMASHEFRTPLGVIDGHAQRLIKMKDRINAEEIAERASKVRSMVLQMTNLIDTLLNSARLFEEDAKLYFHPAEADLAQLLHEVCQLHREITPDRDIQETFASLPAITGDAKLLHQVFSNLLSNAVKYSPDGGVIIVSATKDGDYVIVKVQDQGVGVPEKDKELLFDRYFRGSNVSGITGTGVGLYLARMVVELHGGTIAVESTESIGSTFTVYIPIHLRTKA